MVFLSGNFPGQLSSRARCQRALAARPPSSLSSYKPVSRTLRKWKILYPNPENSLDKQAWNKRICGKSSPLHPPSLQLFSSWLCPPFPIFQEIPSLQPLMILPLSPLPGLFPLAPIAPRFDFWFGFVRLFLSYKPQWP